MNSLKRQAIVPYSARQMYELVNHIEEYPRFLPWCQHSQVLNRGENHVEAELEIAWKGVHKRFSTRNELKPFERMEMRLVEGPLKHMEGIWHFIPLSEQASKVTLDLEFEFAGSFVDKLFQPVFQHIANSLVDAFCKRAVELYGQS